MSRLISEYLTYIFFLSVLTFSHSAIGLAKETEPNYSVDKEYFDIPGHGELVITVPRIWNYNFTKTDENTPPLITFYVLDNKEREIFQLNMSVFWDDSFERNITSPEYIYALVKETGENTLKNSDQNQLEMIEITGTSGTGYLYDLSDSSAMEGEYQYLTQGALAVGDVLLIFSMFSNDEDALLRDAMLHSLKSAEHHFRNDV